MVALGLSASAEKMYKYRVSLKDKVGTAYTVDNPQAFLSERAIERRNRQQLPVDETDLPVSGIYIKELTNVGGRLVTTSKWNNTVVLEVSDTTGQGEGDAFRDRREKGVGTARQHPASQ